MARFAAHSPRQLCAAASLPRFDHQAIAGLEPELFAAIEHMVVGAAIARQPDLSALHTQPACTAGLQTQSAGKMQVARLLGQHLPTR